MKFTCYAVHQNNNKLDTNFEFLSKRIKRMEKNNNLINEIKSHE